MLKNKHIYKIWERSIVHSFGTDEDGEYYESDDVFLNIDYDFIESLPLSIKKIITYYTKNSRDVDKSLLAKSLGRFSTLEEAQEHLLADFEYNEYLPKEYKRIFFSLYMFKDGKEFTFCYPSLKHDYFLDVDRFEIDNNGNIHYIGRLIEAELDLRRNRIIIAP
jgi:hypothetical protein